MEFVEYGSSKGRLAVYFHGAPGAVEETAIFDSYARELNLRIVCFDRFAAEKSLDRESYYQRLANEIEAEALGEPVALIGFSIGSHVALEVAALLRDQVSHIHLISAVAPITAGDFLESMAGGLVFKLARDKPLAFSLLTQWQRIMAVLAPCLLVRMLFSSATGADIELSKRDDFRSYIIPILKQCFQKGASGYTRDIKFYVTWPGVFDGCTSSVSIWHGSEDNWSPFSMASYLCNALSGVTVVETMNGLSHYSCLLKAAPRICTHLAATE